ncbi:T9SS type A sorting domain-containing protein [uncultured Tenacibaculum sp.]|uniref:T9SS type A sorting domain-containing protein n=1 Tax=uncultured Tenacibaculum sp. TaxID=174713 RepID=UPI00261DA43D|nr:T9SS type A sorting domain-containing protein [uncultured Tenacibaculum sp.]
MKKLILSISIFLTSLLNLKAQDVPFTQRLSSGGITVKGDVTFVSNNILNREDSSFSPNDPFNGNGSNGQLNIQYIDVDDDPTTFSSSSSILNVPTCSRVVYAGLYWSAVFPYETWEAEQSRPGDYRNIKFKLPGQDYQDITSDEVIYDNGIATQRPYVCYKDMTAEVSSLSNPNGDYFAANIRGTVGFDAFNGLGGAAGWVLVVIYENETETTKNISLFDGFATIDGTNNADVIFSGIRTTPAGPVRVKTLVATLEGDQSFIGDRYQIKGSNGFYTDLTNQTNPQDNFFNSSITQNGDYVIDRNPSSENTLGFDVDLFEINNPGNAIIANNQTSIEARFTTNGDVYWPFLNAIAVEVSEPDLRVVSTVDDGAGNDLSGSVLSLGADFWYNLQFQNIGNDDATNTTISKRLPKNVNLIPADIIVPAGVTFTYEQPSISNGFRGELIFTVNDSLVEEGSALQNIRFHAELTNDCSGFTASCSNIIESQSFSSYSGVNSVIQISNDPSFSGIDACNKGIVGATSFLVELSNCTDITKEVTLCASSVTLTAASGFVTYQWEDNSGTVIGTSQSITVNTFGTYKVTKGSGTGAPSACLPFSETFNVVSGTGLANNPILNSIDNVLTCSIDGSELSEVYLCGSSDSRNITANVPATYTVQWQELINSTTNNTNCPDTTGTWENVSTSSTNESRVFSEAGQYRLLTASAQGCQQYFYFNVYKNTINPAIAVEDVSCNNGLVSINNISDNYVFALSPSGIVPSASDYQVSNIFDVSAAGYYEVYIKSNDNSCVFTYDVTVGQADLVLFSASTTDPSCTETDGSISINVSSGEAPFTYTIINTLGNNGGVNEAVSNDYSYVFTGLSGGNYEVQVTDNNGCTSLLSLVVSELSPIIVPPLTVTQFGCSSGNVTNNANIALDASLIVGGTGSYASLELFNDNGTPSDSSDDTKVNGTNAGSIYTFDILDVNGGDFYAKVIDSNNCQALSAPATVNAFDELLNVTVTQVDPVGCVTTDELISISYTSSLGASNAVIQIINSAGTVVDTISDVQSNTDVNSNIRLIPGTYIVKVINPVTGCELNQTHEVLNVETYTLSIVNSTPVACFGDSNGSLILTIEDTGLTPYTGTYNYEVFDAGGNPVGISTVASSNPLVINGLSSGSFRVQVTFNEFPFCTLTSADVNVFGPAAPLSVSAHVNGDIITVNETGGNPPYEYSLNNTGFTTSNVFDGVSPGDYTIEVRDINGCAATTFITVTGTNNDIILADDVATTLSSTPIDIDIFSNDTNIPTEGFLNITTPSNGVVQINDSATPNDPSDDIVTYTSDPDFVGTDSFTYSICDISGNSCDTATVFITVDPQVTPMEITLISSDVTCNGDNNGVIQATVSGGVPPYTYVLLDFSSSVIADSSNGIFTNVAVGDYTVEVTDSIGNTSRSINVVILEPELLETTLAIENVSCNGSDDGSITVNSTGGTGGYVYEISSQPGRFQSENTFTGLRPGSYSITVSDDSGCVNVIPVNIEEPETLFISSVDIRATGRFPSGRIKIGADGGSPRYTYSVNGGQFKRSNRFLDLEDGSYTILVKDANGCISNPLTVRIDKIEINNTVNQILEILEALYKNAISYQWIDVDNDVRIPGANQATYKPTKSGRYQVEMVISETSTRMENNTVIRKENSQVVLSPVIEYKSEVLNVEDLEEKILKVYPNPASERLILPVDLINKKYKIYSIIGTEIRSAKISSEEIQVNELARGVYLLKVDGYKPLRFVKK